MLLLLLLSSQMVLTHSTHSTLRRVKANGVDRAGVTHVLQETGLVLHAPDAGGEVGGSGSQNDRRVPGQGDVPDSVAVSLEEPDLRKEKLKIVKKLE